MPRVLEAGEEEEEEGGGVHVDLLPLRWFNISCSLWKAAATRQIRKIFRGETFRVVRPLRGPKTPQNPPKRIQRKPKRRVTTAWPPPKSQKDKMAALIHRHRKHGFIDMWFPLEADYLNWATYFTIICYLYLLPSLRAHAGRPRGRSVFHLPGHHTPHKSSGRSHKLRRPCRYSDMSIHGTDCCLQPHSPSIETIFNIDTWTCGFSHRLSTRWCFLFNGIGYIQQSASNSK